MFFIVQAEVLVQSFNRYESPSRALAKEVYHSATKVASTITVLTKTPTER